MPVDSGVMSPVTTVVVERDKQPQILTVTPRVNDSGDVFTAIQADADAGSIRFVGRIGSDPTLADVQGEPANNGRNVDSAVIDAATGLPMVLDVGEVAHVAAVAYSRSNAGGAEGPLARARLTFTGGGEGSNRVKSANVFQKGDKVYLAVRLDEGALSYKMADSTVSEPAANTGTCFDQTAGIHILGPFAFADTVFITITPFSGSLCAGNQGPEHRLRVQLSVEPTQFDEGTGKKKRLAEYDDGLFAVKAADTLGENIDAGVTDSTGLVAREVDRLFAKPLAADPDDYDAIPGSGTIADGVTINAGLITADEVQLIPDVGGDAALNAPSGGLVIKWGGITGDVLRIQDGIPDPAVDRIFIEREGNIRPAVDKTGSLGDTLTQWSEVRAVNLFLDGDKAGRRFLFTESGGVTVSDTTVETVIVDATWTAGKIGIDDLVVGRITGRYLENSGNTPTINFRFKVKTASTTTILYGDTTGSFLINEERRPVDIYFIYSNSGTNFGQSALGYFKVGSAGGADVGIGDLAGSLHTDALWSGGVSFDNADVIGIEITIQHSSANPATEWRTDDVVIEHIPAA